MQFKQKQEGITIIELMIVIAIAAILLAIAAPSFNEYITDTQMVSTTSQLSGDLNRARSEAIKRNSWVLVCARSNDATCGSDWNNGWLVCADNEPNDACDAGTTANPNPIVVHQAINAKFTLTGDADFVRFNPNGTGGPDALTLDFSGIKSRTANIAVTGNISISNP